MPEPIDLRLAESELYEPLKHGLKDNWAPNQQLAAPVIEITAKQGARDTGGKWSRPDITLVSSTAYTYVPGRQFDVVTFEVKACDAIDVTAVYEALAHRRAATRAYVILHVPNNNDIVKTLIDDVCDEAKRHGIGVIVVGKPEDYGTWEDRVEAIRNEPDPAKLNGFLATQVSQKIKEQVLAWCRFGR